MDPSRERLFFALWPDESTRAAIARWQQEWDWPSRAGPAKPERLHLTLHFLGDVEVTHLPGLVQAMQAVPFAPFDLQLGKGEVWPNGVAVLVPTTVPHELGELHAAMSEQLRALSLPVEERPYRPHVTLARRAFGAVPASNPPLRWRANDGFVLVRSLPGGAGYQILNRFGPA